jgi:hypothetical protein
MLFVRPSLAMMTTNPAWFLHIVNAHVANQTNFCPKRSPTWDLAYAQISDCAICCTFFPLAPLWVDEKNLTAVPVNLYISAAHYQMTQSQMLKWTARLQRPCSSTFGSLNDTAWKHSGFSSATKLKVYRAVVLTTLLYGSETWTVYMHATQDNWITSIFIADGKWIYVVKLDCLCQRRYSDNNTRKQRLRGISKFYLFFSLLNSSQPAASGGLPSRELNWKWSLFFNFLT